MKPVEFEILMRDKTRNAWESVQGSAKKTGAAVEKATADFKKSMKEQSAVVRQVETDIRALEKQLEKTSPGKAKMQLTAELEAAKKVLREEKGELAELGKQFEQTAQKETTLRTQIAQQKQLMAGMREGTKEYAAAMQRLGELQDRYGDISTQARIFSDDNKNIRGTMDAISGLTGAMTAGVGVASLFGAEQEKLSQIQTKLQAVMAITIGIQQVANTLNKDSFFTHTLLAGAKKRWAAAQFYLNTQLGIGVGLSKALMVSGIGVLMVGIGALVALYGKWKEKNKEIVDSQKVLKDTLESSSQNIKQSAGNYGEQRRKLEELRKEWNKLGKDLSAKQKYINENKGAFEELGISIHSIREAESLLVNNTDKFVAALKARAMAVAGQKTVEELYTRQMEAEQKAENHRLGAKVIPLWKRKAAEKAAEEYNKSIYNSPIYKPGMERSAADYIKAWQEGELNKAVEQEKVAKQIEKQIERIGKKIGNNQKKAEELLTDSGLNPYKKGVKKESEDLSLQLNAISDAEIKIRQKIETMQLHLMREGAEKRRKEAKIQYTQEIESIRREERDKLHELQKAQRDGLKVDPKQINSIKSLYEKQRDLAFQIYARQLDSIWREPLDELQKKYRDYAAQRLDIEKKYDKDIRELTVARNQAEAEGKSKIAAEINRNIAKATADKGKELLNLDFDRLKESPEYVRAFEDLKNTSTETLNSLLIQLEKAKATAAQVLAPDQLREYTTTIRELMNEIMDRDPFGALSERMRDMKRAEQELRQTRIDLNVIQSGGRVLSGTRFNADSGKIKRVYLTSAEALARYNLAKDKSIRANNEFIKAEEKVRMQVVALSAAVKEVGTVIGGSAGEVISYIGNISSFVTDSIGGISKVAQSGSNALSAVEKASVILGVISAGIQLMHQLDSILPTADNRYERYAEKIAEINKLTEAVNEYRIAALTAKQAEESWFSIDKLKSLRNYKELHEEIAKAYRDKAGEAQAIYQNKSGGGWFTNSWNWLLDNTYGKIYGIDFGRKYKEGTTAAINNLRIETRRRKRGFLGSGIGGHSQRTEDLGTWIKQQNQWANEELFDKNGLINKELAEAVLRQYGNKLVGQTKETLEALIKLREQYDEYKKQLREYVSSLYEPLADNMVNALWDWLDTGKDALDGFKEYAGGTFRGIVTDMMKTIVLEKVVGRFKDDIARVYEKYASGVINEKELMNQVIDRVNELKSSYTSQLPVLQDVLSSVSDSLKEIGIDMTQKEAFNQSGRAGVITTITQEQGTKLEGTLTSVQDHVSSIDSKMDGFDAAMERALEMLGIIATNTAYCRLLEDVVDYFEKINRDGIRIKD